MKIRPWVIGGTAVVGVLGAAAVAWAYMCRRAWPYSPPTSDPDDNLPFATRDDRVPSSGELRLITRLREYGWPVDTHTTQCGTYDRTPAVRMETEYGIAELSLLTAGGIDSHVLTGYAQDFDGVVRTDVLNGALREPNMPYVDYATLEAYHRPDQQF